MTADPRVTAAREFLDGARRRKVSETPHSVLVREAAESRRQLGQVLDLIAEDGALLAGPVLLGEVVDGLRAEVVDAIDVALACSRAARQLGAIRAVLARVLDSETADRQMALEEIGRIADEGGA